MLGLDIIIELLPLLALVSVCGMIAISLAIYREDKYEQEKWNDKFSEENIYKD